jgi:hypothetical protein
VSKALEAAFDRLTFAVEDRTRMLREHRAEDERRERERREAARIGHRSEPRRLDFGLMMQAVPGLAAQYKRKIPAEFWSITAPELVDVACPCGETPAARLGIPKECVCERFYLYTGEHVRVAGGPKVALVDKEDAALGEVGEGAGQAP